MKYIRTKDGIVGICTHEDNKNVRIKYHDNLGNHCPLFSKEEILKQADTIEELCDEFIGIYKDEEEIDDKEISYFLENLSRENYFKEIYGAIWTDKGLIYVAKMNDKGELELL